jgi:hypothetical protein
MKEFLSDDDKTFFRNLLLQKNDTLTDKLLMEIAKECQTLLMDSLRAKEGIVNNSITIHKPSQHLENIS